MATITTINASDNITDSRAVINTNLANLNSDKIETSYLDTDTAMAANSDVKIPSQKAVKTYIDTNGGQNASTTARGIVEEATEAEVNAGTAAGGTGARLFVNPSTASGLSNCKKALLAGETINGATLPVAVYQNKTDNEFYACDANDTAKLKFLGFAISNGTDGNALTVQFTGLVSGFTGLAEGEKYYVQDDKTIGTTPGTYEILVGIAISTTELLIQKGKRYASGTTSFTSTTSTTITTGFRPSKVTIYAVVAYSGTAIAMSSGGWNVKGGNNCLYFYTADVAGSVGSAYRALNASNDGHSGVVDTITDTGFNINNTEGSGATTVDIIWEAEGEF